MRAARQVPWALIRFSAGLPVTEQVTCRGWEAPSRWTLPEPDQLPRKRSRKSVSAADAAPQVSAVTVHDRAAAAIRRGATMLMQAVPVTRHQRGLPVAGSRGKG